MNFLEQLAREWFESRGYFVKTNLKYGKRAKGGWTGEMDVAAFHPGTGELVHIETSMDADRWDERRPRFERKFKDLEAHLKELFPEGVKSVRRIAVVGWSAEGQAGSLGEGIEVKSIRQFTREVAKDLMPKDPYRQAVPETYPLLRAMQYALHWGIEDSVARR